MHPNIVREEPGTCPECGMALVPAHENSSQHQAVREHNAHGGHDTHAGHGGGSVRKMAASATLHCLAGCAIGELIGVTIGSSAGFAPYHTVLLAAILSFVSGYSVSTVPLVKTGMPFVKALRLVLAADTVSILTMTIVDNILILVIPGALNKNLANPVYWLSRVISLTAAFVAAYPVNLYLLKRGKGHALTHHHMHGGH